MSLIELQKPYGHLLMQVEQKIVATLFQSAPRDLVELLDNAPIKGGKKVRSSLLFMLTGSPESINNETIHVAAALEMLHQASLIHDDVLDHAQLRRDHPTLHSRTDNTVAVLAGDYLLVKALDMIQSLGRPELMNCLIISAKELVVGQILDMIQSDRVPPSFSSYIDILAKKTGSLFAAAAEMAGVLKGLTTSDTQDYHRFGENFGVMFQLQDDIMDLFSTTSGKDRWRDLREGKWTLPTMILKGLQPMMQIFPFTEDRLPEIAAGLETCDILARCQEKLAPFRQQSLAFIDLLPQKEMHHSLKAMVDYVCQRER